MHKPHLHGGGRQRVGRRLGQVHHDGVEGIGGILVPLQVLLTSKSSRSILSIELYIYCRYVDLDVYELRLPRCRLFCLQVLSTGQISCASHVMVDSKVVRRATPGLHDLGQALKVPWQRRVGYHVGESRLPDVRPKIFACSYTLRERL